MKRKIIIKNQTVLYKKTALLIKKISNAAVKQKGFSTIALSGGKTPVELFKTLSSPFFSKKIQWNKIHFFQVDERIVPADDKRRNFKTINEYLFKPLKINTENVHFPDKDLSYTFKAVINYENKIKKFFKEKQINGFDIIILGIGEDGHTASLFPEDKKSLSINNKMIIQTNPSFVKPKVKRITFTMNIINSSNYVIFLVTGENKKNIIKEVINGNPAYPASSVHPDKKLYFSYDQKI